MVYMCIVETKYVTTINLTCSVCVCVCVCMCMCVCTSHTYLRSPGEVYFGLIGWRIVEEILCVYVCVREREREREREIQ